MSRWERGYGAVGACAAGGPLPWWPRPFDHVLVFKVLTHQAMHSLSDERAGSLINDRLLFIRFLGLGRSNNVPQANTIWTLREVLKNAGAIEVLFRRFDEPLRPEGFLVMIGQIVDATIVAAPKQRKTIAEEETFRDAWTPDGWADKPAKMPQKDRDVRWTVKSPR